MFGSSTFECIRQQEELAELRDEVRQLRLTLKNLPSQPTISVETGKTEYTSAQSFYRRKVYKEVPIQEALELAMNHLGIKLVFTEGVEEVKPELRVKSIVLEP